MLWHLIRSVVCVTGLQLCCTLLSLLQIIRQVRARFFYAMKSFVWFGFFIVLSTVHTQRNNEHRVIFGNLVSSHKSVEERRSHRCRRELGVCVANVWNYPSSRTIGDALSESDPLFKILLSDREPQLRSNLLKESGYQQICRVESKTIYPKVGVARNGKLHFVINNEEFFQPVEVEACSGPSRSCHVYRKESQCVQEMKFTPLLVIEDGRHVRKEQLKMPSHCNCYLQANKIRSRFGVPTIANSSYPSANIPHNDRATNDLISGTTTTRFSGRGLEAGVDASENTTD